MDQFYKEVCELLPYKHDKELDYRKRLFNALEEYKRIVSDNKLAYEIQDSITDICAKIRNIVSNSLRGLQSTAALQLQNLIQGKIGLAPKINLTNTILTCNIDSDFYRIRQLPSVYEIEAK